MMFETMPEIILHIWMYYRITNFEIVDETVNLNTILVSIAMAFAHGILELLTLWIEARVYQ